MLHMMKYPGAQKQVADAYGICFIAGDVLVDKGLHCLASHKAFRIRSRWKSMSAVLDIQNPVDLGRQRFEIVGF